MNKRNLIAAVTVLFASIVAPLTVAQINAPKSVLFSSDFHRVNVTMEAQSTMVLDPVIVKAETTVNKVASAKKLVCSAKRNLVQDIAPRFDRNYDGHQTVKVCEYQ